jgi:restriction system protein
MAVWLVRAGSHGEREELALEQSLAVIGWEELPDLSGVKSREALEALCHEVYPDQKLNTIRNWVGQVWAFLGRISEGDLVALPLKKQSAIAIGRVTGPYRYRPDLPENARHTRTVKWLRPDIPRTAFEKDLLYSLGAFMTVCQIERNNAEARIRAMLTNKAAPPPPQDVVDNAATSDTTTTLIDLEVYARDLIRDRISQTFKTHEFERLVENILRAQGYQTSRTGKGADGGVDIVAGRGAMGFDAPRLCVQVKSSQYPEDIKTVRELQGVVRQFGAQQGLLVSWGGYKASVAAEKRRLFFEIRLWDADDVIDAILENYERLSDDIKAELPLKRIWTLVLDEGSAE